MTLEIAASIRSDCALTLTARLRKCAKIRAGNPSLLPARFRTVAVAAVRLGRGRHFNVELGAAEVERASKRERNGGR